MRNGFWLLGIITVVVLCVLLGVKHREGAAVTDSQPSKTRADKHQTEEKAAAGNLQDSRQKKPPEKQQTTLEKLYSPQAVREEWSRLVDGEYSQALNDLHIAEIDQQKIKDLLVDRIERHKDVNDAIMAAHVARSSDVDNTSLLNSINTENDKAIRDVAGEQAWGTLKQILDVEFQWGRVQQNYVPVFKTAGQPLTTDQCLALAKALNSGDSSSDSENVARRKEIDATTGLSGLDQVMITQLANDLSSEQLALFRQSLLRKNQTKQP